MTTKKTPTVSKPRRVAEMRANYRLDYSQARPSRFAGRAAQDRVVVVLDPDIAAVFHDSEAVNHALRAHLRDAAERQVAAGKPPSSVGCF